MAPLALVRPLWWAACRTLRFLTGLALPALALALALTAAGHRAPQAGPAEPPPLASAGAVVSTTSDSAPDAATVDDLTGQRPDDGAIETRPAERATATTGAPAARATPPALPEHRPADATGQPLWRPVDTLTGQPTDDASGQRAPPLD